MNYMGSKRRIAKDILPIILSDRRPGQYYVEPFCGGCNSLEHVDGPRLAADINKHLIAMWKGLQKDLPRPMEISREMYNNARTDFKAGTNEYYDDFTLGWIGGMASFNGKFFGGYSGVSKGVDYVQRQIRNITKQLPRLMDVEFHHCGYDTLPIPPESIIYCDIPYKGTTQYHVSRGFDHDKFWSWCVDQKKRDTVCS